MQWQLTPAVLTQMFSIHLAAVAVIQSRLQVVAQVTVTPHLLEGETYFYFLFITCINPFRGTGQLILFFPLYFRSAMAPRTLASSFSRETSTTDRYY